MRHSCAAGLLGDVTSVAVGPDGSIWQLSRGSSRWEGGTFDPQNRLTARRVVPEAVVAQLEPASGRVLQRWGAKQLALPHMITVDRFGAVWVVDVGLHQVRLHVA